MADLRCGAFEFAIKRQEELIVENDSVMLDGVQREASGPPEVTSGEFAAQYNLAQVLAAPMAR